jgi:TetR/AcrR family transcriptional regulator, mexJK operon transcriptional repressor
MAPPIKSHARRKPPPGRPKDPDKREAILEAARALFVAQGFEATSMDAVAQSAGVSKLTVYSHFGDKDQLFSQAVIAQCEAQLPPALFHIPKRASMRTALLSIARGFHALVHSEDALNLHRIMVANSGQGTHLADLFFRAGPQRLLSDFESFLREAVLNGQLQVRDPRRAAGHFFCLVKGLDHMRKLVGCACVDAGVDAEAHLKSVVDLFLLAHAPPRT